VRLDHDPESAKIFACRSADFSPQDASDREKSELRGFAKILGSTR
jgi:hypothetical protein